MEEIENSITLRERIDSLLKEDSDAKTKLESLAFKIGEILAKLHSVDIVHGDLTTSNVLVSNDQEEVFTLIDFGLCQVSKFPEDMGVDLYVLERAFLSTHPNTEWLFEKVLETYTKLSKDQKKNKDIMGKLNEVRMRGRKRVMLG